MAKKIKHRLLLINPWIFDFTAFDLWSKPIGLLYIAAYLRKIGYKIDFIDCLDKFNPVFLKWMGNKKSKIKKYGTGPFYREVVNKPEILTFVPRKFARYGMPEHIFISELNKVKNPSAILVTSFMTYWYLGPKRVVQIVRQIFPDVPIILGGIYATLLPTHAERHVKPDFIVQGAGEIKVEKLLAEILSNAPRAKTAPQYLDDFPSPALDLYSQLKYLPVMTSRGCPYHCTFCATDKLSGKYAQRQPEFVVKEIIEFVKKYKIQDIAFYDDALLLNKNKRLIPILETLSRERLNLRFHTPNGLHAREINKEIANIFFKSGFKTIRLSFETVNKERLHDMNNKVLPSDLEGAVKNLLAAGYSPKDLESYILMGLPNQTFEEIYESILFVHSLGIKVQLASYSPIPGTVDYQRAVVAGLFPGDADPLLTNKSLYPLHRSMEDYIKFQNIRQFVNILNQGIDRGVNLFVPTELKKAFRKMTEMI